MSNRRWIMICVWFALLMAILACNFSPLEPDAGGDATEQALRTSIAGNATVAAEIEATTQAEQAQPTVTQTAPSVSPTPAVEETSAAPVPGPTQTALAPIMGELSLYGIDPQQGELAWIQPPSAWRWMNSTAPSSTPSFRLP